MINVAGVLPVAMPSPSNLLSRMADAFTVLIRGVFAVSSVESFAKREGSRRFLLSTLLEN
jgi:hypothetical protein